MKSYVLDTSALLTLHNDESGANKVESLMRQVDDKQARVLISFMSFMEYFYVCCRREGKAIAYRSYLELKMLPLERIEMNERLLLRAGTLKAEYPISLADAWIAATALEEEAILVHKDPEYEVLSDQLTLQTLPYK